MAADQASHDHPWLKWESLVTAAGFLALIVGVLSVSSISALTSAQTQLVPILAAIAAFGFVGTVVGTSKTLLYIIRYVPIAQVLFIIAGIAGAGTAYVSFPHVVQFQKVNTPGFD